MNTLVTFFNKDPIKDILGAYCFRPRRVIFLATDCESDETDRQTVVRLFSSWGYRPEVQFRTLHKHDPWLIEKVLSDVCQKDPDCVFECSGGKDLPLLTAGICLHGRGIPLFYIDAGAGRFIDLGGCENLVPKFTLPHFHVKDVLLSAGAKIGGYGHFVPDLEDKKVSGMVSDVFQLVLDNLKAWGGLVGYLQHVTRIHESTEGVLSFTAHKVIETENGILKWNPKLFSSLTEIGVYTDYGEDGDRIHFTYLNNTIKRCMMIHGLWLELSTYIALSASESFDSVKTSVVIDWDGGDRPSSFTRNEVDLILVSGVTPVFVSCKMGVPQPQALYEIKLLATRFGGENARAVLLSAAPVRRESPSIAMRAADAGVTLFDLDDIRKNKLEDLFCGLL